MISTIELKKYVASAGILGIDIDKLYYEKKLYPIILLEVDKGLEIGFYYIILPFDLVVCLWVKENGKFPLNVKEIA